MRPAPRTPIALLAAIVTALALAAAPVQAHGAPSARDYEVRLLHDYNDDCGGDGVTTNCNGSHDLIALDAREAWVDGEPALVLRLTMDRGSGGTIEDVITFKIAGKSHTFTLRTLNDQSFTSDFDSNTKAMLIGDETRFAVEGTVSLQKLGASVGDVMTAYKVTSKKGGSVGDVMTEDQSLLGQGDTPTNFVRPDYTLRGPSYYLDLTGPTEQTVRATEDIVRLTLTNNLRNEAQRIDLSLAGADGIDARFHDPVTGDYSPTITVDFAKSGSGEIHVAVRSLGQAASGTIKVTAMSDLGGHTTFDLVYHTEDVQSSPTPTATATKASDRSSPGAGILIAIALLGAVWHKA